MTDSGGARSPRLWLRAVAILGLAALAGCTVLFEPRAADDEEACADQAIAAALEPRSFSLDGTPTFLLRHLDAQGALSFWVTLQLDGAELPEDVPLVDLAGATVTLTANGTVEASLPGQASPITVTGEAGRWEAGEPHLVVLRWNVHHPLTGYPSDSPKHVSLTVDDTTEYGADDPSNLEFTGATLVLGSAGAHALVDHAVLYRRPLQALVTGDGDLGRLYAAGRSDNTLLLGGTWDVLLATSGTGPGCADYALEGFTHPLERNILGAGGLLLSDGPLLDGWTPSAGDQEPTKLDPAEAIFRRAGFAFPSSTSVTREIETGPGGSFVLRALAHSDGLAVPAVEVRTAEGGELLTGLAGPATSTREAPAELHVTFEVPLDASVIEVALLNASDTDSLAFFHAVDLQANLLGNAGFEEPFTDEEPWRTDDLPDGSGASTELPHSGARSLLIRSSAEDSPHMVLQEPDEDELEDYAFYGVGAVFYWMDGHAPTISVGNGSLFAINAPYDRHHKLAMGGVEAPEVWQHVGGAGKRLKNNEENNHNDLLGFGNGSRESATNLRLDDAYVIELRRIQPN